MSHPSKSSHLGDREVSELVSTEQYGLAKCSSVQKLSPLDMNMPRVYATRWILCFPLPVNASNDQIYEDLNKGLAHTIAAIPWLAGSLGPEEGSDPKLNRIQITDGLGGVIFRKRDLSKVLPSYHDLKLAHFPLAQLSTAQLSPVEFMPQQTSPVMAVQANFINEGLLLTVAVHHSVCDGLGVDLIVESWANYTAAITRGESQISTELDLPSNDRNPLMTGEPGADISEFTEYVLMPTPQDIGMDMNTHQMAETPYQLPPMTAHVFYFSPESLAALKNAAASYSTNDALMAFLWVHMTMARSIAPSSNTSESSEGQKSAILFATNIRGLVSPPMPQSYLGNASMAIITPQLSTSTLTAEDGPTRAAATIRSCINKFNSTPNRTARTIGLLTSRPDPTDFKFAYNGFLGPDVSATSWAKFGVLKHNWGSLGVPSAFRIPGEGSDGTIVVFPQITGGGLEVMVGLEAGAMQRLLADRDFSQTAVLWG